MTTPDAHTAGDRARERPEVSFGLGESTTRPARNSGPLSLDEALEAVAVGRRVAAAAAAGLAAAGKGALDDNQVLAYDLAHVTAGLEVAAVGLSNCPKNPESVKLAKIFAADALADLASRMFSQEQAWSATTTSLDAAWRFVNAHHRPEYVASSQLESALGPSGMLDADFEMVAGAFRRFAEERVGPLAESIHRKNLDVPEAVIDGLGELGAFGLSIPEAYGGAATGDGNDYLAMVVATEELSRVSLGAAGSLITRPEILARALLAGGTEDQKLRWLPRLATGKIMAAVAVTEPDHGSDVAGLTFSASPHGDGWRLDGTKTWCTFAARADVLMVLARTDPDRSAGHRGLSLFVVEKDRAPSAGFVLSQPDGGRLEGRPIDTLGYRGMHSYELAFDAWRVPGDCLVGGQAGLGRGFYLQMEGFENGRLQTAARAVGLMQAAFEAALGYAQQRVVFGRPTVDYQLTRVKLARMAATVQSCRAYNYHAAGLAARGAARLEASLIKAFSCRAAEWVAREALQIHGGMGYAEEYPVSRYFVDARVLSIFEGADETLALKVIARRLVEAAGDAPLGG
jgi:(2S)-methylsuccinyl-CoA dehydrogenase